MYHDLPPFSPPAQQTHEVQRKSAALVELEKREEARDTLCITFDKMSFNLPWARRNNFF